MLGFKVPKAPPIHEPSAGGAGELPASRIAHRLRCLRVASLDRLARECGLEGKAAVRSALVEELRAFGSAVTWIGENIVCLEEGEP